MIFFLLIVNGNNILYTMSQFAELTKYYIEVATNNKWSLKGIELMTQPNVEQKLEQMYKNDHHDLSQILTQMINVILNNTNMRYMVSHYYFRKYTDILEKWNLFRSGKMKSYNRDNNELRSIIEHLSTIYYNSHHRKQITQTLNMYLINDLTNIVNEYNEFQFKFPHINNEYEAISKCFIVFKQ